MDEGRGGRGGAGVGAVVGRRRGVGWEKYVGGGERRLAAEREVCSVAVGQGHVCGGLSDGMIGVWSRSTGKERMLAGHSSAVRALLFF